MADRVLPSAFQHVTSFSSSRTPVGRVLPAHYEENRARWLVSHASLSFVKRLQLCLIDRVRSSRDPDFARAER